MKWGQRPKVVVGYPVGGSVTLAFHASLVRMACYELGKPDRHRLLAKITHSQGLYVGENRTLLARKFLETDADWLLQIDTDIEFPQTLAETLVGLAPGPGVLAASVPLGAYPTCAFRMIPGQVGVWQSVPVTTQPQEVDGIATAVCLIHRDVFLSIAEKHGQAWFHHMYLPASPEGTPQKDFRFLEQGEDLAFSIRARDAGHKVWCAHVPGLKHHKTRALSHDALEAEAGVGVLQEAS